MSIIKAQHGLDAPLLGRNRRKVISSWMHYREPGTDWMLTEQNPEKATGVPSNWQGNFDFKYQSLKGPLQVFLGDSTDPINTALIGMRKSDDPGSWVNFKALGIDNSVEMEVFPALKAARWKDIWANCDLMYQLSRNRINKIIRLKQLGHPVAFRFAMRIPDGYSYIVQNNCIKIIDSEGAVCLETLAPWGRDSSVIEKQISVRLVEGNPVTVGGRQYPTFWVAPDQDQLSNATYPIDIDPTTSITGTSDIDDAQLYANGADGNYGGLGQFRLEYVNDSIRYSAVIRIATSAIPEGNITAFRMKGNVNPAVVGATTNAYIINDANNWVEGTTGGATQAGSCCWNQAQYGILDWAGGNSGCAADGTDYDSDASPPQYISTSTGEQAFTYTLDSSWPPLWRDGDRVNNGFVCVSQVAEGRLIFRSSEYASAPLNFEIDYSESAPASVTGLGRVLIALPRRIK